MSYPDPADYRTPVRFWPRLLAYVITFGILAWLFQGVWMR